MVCAFAFLLAFFVFLTQPQINKLLSLRFYNDKYVNLMDFFVTPATVSNLKPNQITQAKEYLRSRFSLVFKFGIACFAVWLRIFPSLSLSATLSGHNSSLRFLRQKATKWLFLVLRAFPSFAFVWPTTTTTNENHRFGGRMPTFQAFL